MNKLSKLTLLLCGVATLSWADKSSASVVDLGAANSYVLLAFNSVNVSDSAYNGGDIGVVNGNWQQSGGGGTDRQKATRLFLSSGHTFNGPSVINVFANSNAGLNNAWANAQAASAMLKSLAPTQTLGDISSGLTITESAVGNYVFNIGNINLNQSALKLVAPQGSTFVLNISGNVTLNGGSQGNGLLIGGGLTVGDVVYNLTAANANLTTSGGGNAQVIQGIILATGSNASVNLHPGSVLGQTIATTFTASSGAYLDMPPTITQFPEVTPASLIFGFLGLIVAATSRRALMGRVQAIAQRK